MALQLAGFTGVRRLGAGNFGEVFAARDNASGQLLVVKRIPKSKVRLDMVRTEVAVLQRLEPTCKPYILCYSGFREDAANYYIITEFLDGFTPLEDIVDGKAGLITDAQKAGIAKKAIEGLGEIHAKGVAHRDIKPANVMANLKTGEVKYIDFGLACMAAGCSTTVVSGSPEYEAPEMFLAGSQVPRPMWSIQSLQKTDMFSLGNTLWELANGRLFPQWVNATALWLQRRNPQALASIRALVGVQQSLRWLRIFAQSYNYTNPRDQLAAKNRATEAFYRQNAQISLIPLLQRNPALRSLPK
jgi:serine/threonine protein kinase